MPALLDIPPELAPLQELLGRALVRVAGLVQDRLRSDLTPVQTLVVHAERYHGKMIRPMLCVLSGLACDRSADASAGEGHLTSDRLTVAAVCEMVHLATLVHDDVLDEADTRRRTETINHLHGNEAAVILGDYLFSAAFALCAQLGDQRTSAEIARVGMALCAGELLQNHHRGNHALDERTYYAIVERKTASLIAAACRLGARFGGADDSTEGRLERYGCALGVAFQIQDDLLDLTGDQSVVGKSVGKDLEKGKLTLPLIHHLAHAQPGTRERTLAILDNAELHAGEHPGDRPAELIANLHASGSIVYAQAQAQALVNTAREAIAPLPTSPAKRLLQVMADTVVQRAF